MHDCPHNSSEHSPKFDSSSASERVASSHNNELTQNEARRPSVVSTEPEAQGLGIDEIVVHAEADCRATPRSGDASGTGTPPCATSLRSTTTK
jgi:hypothetical protein